jgi:Tfp pilus assembly protein PilN
MPIRVNLLAEAQAAEVERRKDPVKRGLIVGAILVAVVLGWAAKLQISIGTSKTELTTLETKWQSLEKSYAGVVESQRQMIEAEQKLVALEQMTTNRFLWGTALNAFQQTLNGIDDIQVVRFRTEQLYAMTEEKKANTNGTIVIPGKPGLATEKISMTIEAIDANRQPGSQVNHFKETVANVPWFQSNLQKTNGVLLTSLSAPQSTGSKPFVMFTLQCFFPEITR